MWYFAWALGIGFAVLLAILNALWGDNEEARLASLRTTTPDDQPN
ncbi:MAG: Cyd operon protein YbgT [Rhodocyclaceae bacterium]|nr:MAG: Cyd operon protein YbgT [Rhodocyclaceae bacterium]